jgi:serine protease Do
VLVETQGPAVVNVVTTRTRGGAGGPEASDDPLSEFLKRFMPQQPPDPGPERGQGIGSGFIITTDGYVLTNAHVVADSDEVTVRLADSREFKGKIVGVDSRTDVALLKLSATGLPTVKLGNSESLKVGEWVAAIGSPFGFVNTITAGIVSAKGRSLPDETFVPFIQTDVAVNPGNSGGPLLNLRGEVVGINSAIYSRTGGYMGVSFAIPIEVALDVGSACRYRPSRPSSRNRSSCRAPTACSSLRSSPRARPIRQVFRRATSSSHSKASPSAARPSFRASSLQPSPARR